jgi:hypothetical protein
LPLPMQDSLPAGWLAFTGRELNPLDRDERFPSCYISSPFPCMGFCLSRGCRKGPIHWAPSLSLFSHTRCQLLFLRSVTACALPSLCVIERTAAYEAGLAGRGQGRQPPKAGAKPALTAARARPKSSADRWPGRHEGAVGDDDVEGSPRVVHECSCHILVFGGSETRTHDAVMRIGSEAPRWRTHSFVRH